MPPPKPAAPEHRTAARTGEAARGRLARLFVHAAAPRPRLVLAAFGVLFALQGLHGAVVLGVFGDVGPQWGRWGSEVLIGSGAAFVVWRAWTIEEKRRAWRAIAVSMVLYLVADLGYAAFLFGREDPPFPTVVDGFYLAQYAPLFLGLVLLARDGTGRPTRSQLLEGLTGALAIGSLAAALALRPSLLDTGGSLGAAVTTVAYPSLDVVLLFLGAGGLVLQRGRPTRGYVLLLVGLLVMAAVDTRYATEVAAGTYRDGGPLDIGWPLGTTLMARAAWAPDRDRVLHEAWGWRARVVTGIYSVLIVGLLAWTAVQPLDPAARVLLILAVVSLLVLQLSWGEERHHLQAERDRLLMAEQVRVAERDRDQALQASRLKSAFLANMSHEIRSPLNGVIGMTELLQLTRLDAKQQQFAKAAAQSGEALLDIVDDILDLSKIEAGMLQIEPEPFSVRGAIDAAVATLAAEAARKQLVVDVEVSPAIPHLLVGDGGRIRQVITNLLANAVKFTADGRVDIRASQTAGQDGWVELRIAIVDTGIGIAPASLEEMFEPFNQADVSTTRMYGGTGLGLTISRQLVELMGGRVGASSVLDQGSTFWFELPLLIAEECVDAEPAGVAAPAELATRAEQSRVLVVDDGATNRLVAVSLLEHFGYRTDVAENGFDALAALSAERYDAVLMDCQMPGMDGYETTRELRRREAGGPRTPVIAVTANAMAEDRRRCLNAGMDDYLSKPLRPRRLQSVLTQWLEGVAAPAPAPEDVPAAAAGVLDPVMVEDLRSLGTRDFEEMVALFLADAEQLHGELGVAVARHDATTVAQIAHKLKGGSLGFGARLLAGRAAELDQLARSGSLAGVDDGLRSVEAALEATRTAFAREGAAAG